METNNQYIAYSDESNHTDGRYGSISIVSLSYSDSELINNELLTILRESGITEFKWNKLGSAREKFAAIKMVDFALKYTINKKMRVDTIIWDLEDSRHKIKKRDQQENFRRMYFHALKNVFNCRWGTGLKWMIRPDQNSSVDWSKVKMILNYSSDKKQIFDFNSEEYEILELKQFNITHIEQAISKDTPLIQMADLLAGLSTYSYLCFDKYNEFVTQSSGQQNLELFATNNSLILNDKDKNRCEILHHLYCECKKYKLTLSLKSKKGLNTRNPKKSHLNFWLYEPQGDYDKAPIKRKQ